MSKFTFRRWLASSKTVYWHNQFIALYFLRSVGILCKNISKIEKFTY